MMSQTKSKTLSDRLAELANPTPQFADPEDEFNEETKARLDVFDDQYELQTTSKKTLKNKTSLRHKNVGLLAVTDKRYAGKHVSRKELEFQVDEDENEDFSSVSSLVSGSESEEDDILGFKDKFIKTTNEKSKKLNPHSDEELNDESALESDVDDRNSLSSEEVEGDKDEELGEEEDGEEEEDDGEEEEDDGEEEEEEVGSVDDNEEDESEISVQKMSKTSQGTDINKGKCVQNQLSLWDHLLECRIKMHKGINLCNQLPQGPVYKQFTKIAGENHFMTAGQGAQIAIKTLLDNCLELQDLLLKANPQTKSLTKGKSGERESDEEIASDTGEEVSDDDEEIEDEGPKHKRLKMAGYEAEIEKRHDNFRGFCHRTLNMWNEKTKMASGRTGSGSKAGFGAFDQSILKQIEGILSDKQRLINRTRIKRASYRVLGSVQQMVIDGKEEESTKHEEHPNKACEEFDPEIYDDDDFYHQLLRELIEKKTGEAGSNQIALGRQWLEIQKLRSKAKRKVDSKASKGRRLRYQVHPKLVSFMAPYPETSWNDIAKNELFASLFGSQPLAS